VLIASRFAPDPSSQKPRTIGGNVAEKCRRPRTLAHGVTTNHVAALELVLPDGEVVRVGSKQGEPFRPALGNRL
jgi:glycolate oxidase